MNDSADHSNNTPPEAEQPWTAAAAVQGIKDKIKKSVADAKDSIDTALQPVILFDARYQHDKEQIEAGKRSGGGFDIKPSRTVSVNDLNPGFNFKPGEDLKVEFPDVIDKVSGKGEKRYFFLHIPTTYDPNKKAPLALLFNGLGPVGQAEFPSFSGMQEACDKKGIITAYLEGVEPQHTFNNGQWPFNVHSTDDLGLVGRMLNTLTTALPIDQKRLYSGGFSNGGSFSKKVAMTYPFAADAGVESWLTDQNPNLHPGPLEAPRPQPFSELDIYGKRDPVIPENGSQGLKDDKAAWSKMYAESPTTAALTELYLNEISGAPYVNQPIISALHEGMLMAMQQPFGDPNKFVVEPKKFTVDYMRDLDGIPNQVPAKVDQNKDRTISQWYSSVNRTEVEQVVLPENEHAWPGSKDHRRDMPLVGTPQMSFDTANEIVNFWLRHTLDDRDPVNVNVSKSDNAPKPPKG